MNKTPIFVLMMKYMVPEPAETENAFRNNSFGVCTSNACLNSLVVPLPFEMCISKKLFVKKECFPSSYTCEASVM